MATMASSTSPWSFTSEPSPCPYSTTVGSPSSSCSREAQPQPLPPPPSSNRVAAPAATHLTVETHRRAIPTPPDHHPRSRHPRAHLRHPSPLSTRHPMAGITPRHRAPPRRGPPVHRRRAARTRHLTRRGLGFRVRRRGRHAPGATRLQAAASTRRRARRITGRRARFAPRSKEEEERAPGVYG